MQARWQLWQAAWALWLQHPWLGIGPHGFGLEYRAAVDTAWVDPRHTPWPHQLPLELLANTGLISLLAFSRVVQQALIGLRSGQADRQALLQASALSFIVFSTVCLLEASTLRLWWWVVLACLLGSLRPDENRQ
jgi:O-antigen ligase